MEPEIRPFNDNIFKRYTDAYLSSNFARSEFSRVLRNFLPGFSTIEKILTLQPLAEGELLSSVVPVATEVPIRQRMRDSVPSKKINLDAYRQELRDNNIFYRENPEPVKDIVQETNEELLSK